MGNEKKMLLFTGIQASGKTSFYKMHFEGMYEHISLDILHTRNKERIAIEECINNGRSFVVDNTNPAKNDRKKYISIAKQNEYQVIGYYFKSSIRECALRNEKREGRARVPGCAIANTSNRLEIPDYDEGFDCLYYVYMENGEFIVEEWRKEK